MTVDDINKLIRTFIRETLAMPANSVRPANKTAPTGKQTEQFATVLVTLIEDTGHDDRKTANDAALALTVTETIIGMRKLSVSVQFFRGDALTKASKLKSRMTLSSSIDKLKAINLGFVRASQPRNLSALVDAAWEERGQIDLEFYLIATETETLNTFGTFPISINTASSSSINREVIAP